MGGGGMPPLGMDCIPGWYPPPGGGGMPLLGMDCIPG
jgi:hypothetical protein